MTKRRRLECEIIIAAQRAAAAKRAKDAGLLEGDYYSYYRDVNTGVIISIGFFKSADEANRAYNEYIKTKEELK